MKKRKIVLEMPSDLSKQQTKERLLIAVLPNEMFPELRLLAAIEQGKRDVDLEIITIEALGDWIKKKRVELGRTDTPPPGDWDWTGDWDWNSD